MRCDGAWWKQRTSPDRTPVLIDKFLDGAVEVDVDAITDGVDVYIAGVMQQIEEAGVHSGDSACALPPFSRPPAIEAELRRQTRLLARRLGVVGLMNVQYAIQGDDIYVLEVNPRQPDCALCGKGDVGAGGENCGTGHRWRAVGPVSVDRASTSPRSGQRGDVAFHPLAEH